MTHDKAGTAPRGSYNSSGGRAPSRTPSLEALEPRRLLSTYYVSTAGSDGAAGGSAAPWRTLQRAADAVRAGDTVVVRPGTYAGFTLTTSGTAAAPVTFSAQPGVVVDRGPTYAYAIDLEGASYAVVEGFRVDVAAGVQANTGIRSVENQGVTIRNNVVNRATWWGILTGFSERVTIEGNTVTNTQNEHGIYVGNSADYPVIRGNTLSGNRKSGIHINGDVQLGGDGVISHALVEGNVIFGNGLGPGGSGINCDGVTDSVIRDNLLYDNYRSGISLYKDTGGAPSTGNLVANNTVVMPADGSGYWALNVKDGSTGNTALNNVFYHYGGRGSVDISPDSLPGFASDYNAVVDKFSIGDDDYSPGTTLAQWRARTGQDAHSVLAAPAQLFADPAAGDFRPRAGGPAVDAGAAALAGHAAPAADLAGAPRPLGGGYDIGAYEFDPAPDATPPVISAVAASNVSGVGATINWTTNEASDTQVEYGPTASYGSSTTLATAMVTSHGVNLAGLSPNTAYHYRVRSRDAAGNLAVSADLTFTTGAPDVTPPALSAIAAANVSVSGASVTWASDEAADGQVEYGTSTAYGSTTALDPTMVTSHGVALTGLSPSTTYHFRVRSKDASGNLTVSGDFTFTTGDVGQLPSGAVGYWQFNESSGTSASDSSGSGNTGTLVNGPTFVAGRDAGNALNFDGVNDQVRITRNAGLEPAKVSLSAWIKLASGVTQQDWATIIKKTFDNDNSEPYGTYSLQLSPSGQGNYLTFHTGHSTGGNELVSAAPIPTGQWVHVAATYDPSTGEKKLYVNGTLVASATLTAPLVYDTTSAGDLYIGQDPGAAEAFQGAIDDVGVWNRALTAAEVQTLAYNGADTTGPTISSVSSSSVTNAGATISWSTNEASDTQVQYGPTTAYGSTTTLNATKVTSHSAALAGLVASTTYHYRVLSRDTAGNLTVSADFTFTTAAAPDTTAPVISGVGSSGLSSSGATVTWTTNEASDTQVEYGTSTAYGSTSTLNTSKVTSHSVTLAGLQPSTTYHFRVKSRDAAGNLATSADFTFTTPAAPDTTAPVISGVSTSGISTTGGTVTWTTNEAADSQVQYGTTTSYGSTTTLDTTKVTSHSVSLTGLTPGTVYHFRIKSRDAAGNLRTSADFTFTTAAVAQPGQFKFSSATYTTTEDGVSILITVTRTGGTTGSVSVNYSTSDGTALAGYDYTATTGTLTFADGETEKTFSIPVIDDALAEDAETFNLTLSNPTGGATLGAQSTATVTITDDDPPADPGSTGLANGIAYDASGTMYMAYYDDATRDLKFATRTPAGDWSMVQGVDAGLDVGMYLSLALDSAGLPGIAYLDGTNADLKYAHFNGTSWDVQVVDSKYTTGYYPSLQYGAGDRPVISYYYKTGGDLRLATAGSTGWTIATVDARGDVGRYSTLALNPLTGRWSVGYEDTTHGTFRYAEQTKRGWSALTVDATTKIGGGYISMAFSPLTKRPAMSYYDAYNADLKFAAFNGTKWVVQTVASKGTVGLYSNLRIRPDTGDADILYYNKGADGVFRAQVSSATWTLGQVASDGGRWLSSAVAPNGVWTASWLSSTGITWLDL